MKLVLKLTDEQNNVTTKSFDKLDDSVNDGKLKDLANKYALLTNGVSKTASKVVTTVLDLD